MSNTSMFKKRISDSKFLVIAVAILALVVDASLMAIALLGELDAVHWVLPMIVAILDLIIIPVALASNLYTLSDDIFSFPLYQPSNTIPGSLFS